MFERSTGERQLDGMPVRQAVDLEALDAMESDSHRPKQLGALVLAEFVHTFRSHWCMCCLDLRLLHTFHRRRRIRSCNANRIDDFGHFVFLFVQ